MKNMILKYFDNKTYQVDRFMFMNLLRMESFLKRLFFLVLVLLPLASRASAQTSGQVAANLDSGKYTGTYTIQVDY